MTFSALQIRAALAIAALLLAGWAGKAWLDQREDRIRLEAELSATRRLLEAKQAELAGVSRGMEERGQRLAETLKQVEALKARPLPVREIVKEIPKYIPITEPKVQDSGVSSQESGIQSANPEIILDAEQSKGLREYYLECHAQTLKLRACEDDATDWKRKELIWSERQKLLEEERDAALRAVRGGSLWRRFKRNAKWFLAGAVAGTAAGVAAAR